MRAPMRLGFAILAAASLAACGNRELYHRYRAERAFWHAQRKLAGLRLEPRLVRPEHYRAADEAFARIEREFPAAVWADSARLGDPYVRDVAVLAGRAVLERARLAELQGHDQEALEHYGRAGRAFRAVLPVAVESALGRARALERRGRTREAIEEWTAVAVRFPFADAGQPIEGVMDAPLHAADLARDAGDPARAAAVLEDAVARYRAGIAGSRGGDLAGPLWLRVAEAEKRRDHPADAARALRAALAEPALGKRRHEVVNALAELWLGARSPDTALVYAVWLGVEWPELAGAQAGLLRARALEARGDVPAALAAYGEFVDRFSHYESAAGFSMLRRARLLEDRDQWDLAAAEYHALAARYPASEEAMEGLVRECAHYLAEGDSARARAEGGRYLARLDRVIEQYRDSGVEMLAHRTQADLRLLWGDWEGGYRALLELWRRYRTVPLGEAAGFRAARLAEERLRDTSEAGRLYRELAAEAPSERGRAQARDRAARLAVAGATP